MSWRWNLINFAALLDWSCETANYSDFTEKQQILNQIWRIANAFHCQVFHCFEFHSFNVKILEQKVRFAECYISSPCSIQIGENGSESIRVDTSKGEWKGSEKKKGHISIAGERRIWQFQKPIYWLAPPRALQNWRKSVFANNETYNFLHVRAHSGTLMLSTSVQCFHWP